MNACGHKMAAMLTMESSTSSHWIGHVTVFACTQGWWGGLEGASAPPPPSLNWPSSEYLTRNLATETVKHTSFTSPCSNGHWQEAECA